MTRALHLLLLLGALIGLFGLEGAYAAGPRLTPVAAPAATAEMDPDCMAIMQQQEQPAKPAKPAPCKGMTLDCIAAMGCVVPVMVQDAHSATAMRRTIAPQAFWPSTSVLRGGDVPPEQHPPTILG